MKRSFSTALLPALRSRLSGAVMAALCAVTAIAPPAAASLFDAEEIDNLNDFVVIAEPVGQTNRHKLLIVEQLRNRNTQPCWREVPGTPTEIEPLLQSFDFTGICGRMGDSNAYSVRIDGEDFGLQYDIRVEDRDGESVLLAVPFFRNSGFPELEIGSAGGLATGFAKLELNPGWRLARRSYRGIILGHIYLTTDDSLATLMGLTDDGAAPLDVPR